MIKKIEIIELFGSGEKFDYKINFNTNPCYITGPNGYGKTKILDTIRTIIGFPNNIWFLFTGYNHIQKFSIEFTDGETLEYELGSNKTLYIRWDDSKQPFQDLRWFEEEKRIEYPELAIKLLEENSVYMIEDCNKESYKDYTKYYGFSFDKIGKKNEEMKYLLTRFPKFGFQNQKLVIDEEGFDIVDKAEVSFVPFLGSGEERLLTILCELLFNNRKIYLIDNVELFLHPGILHTFADIIDEIIKMKNIQVICTTSSPSFIGCNWNRVVDLFDLSKEEEK